MFKNSLNLLLGGARLNNFILCPSLRGDING